MDQRDFIGHWKINANNYLGKLEIWRSENNWGGRVWFDAHQKWETLTNITLNPATSQIQFTRDDQQYTGTLAFDELLGAFTHAGQSYPWRAQKAWSALTKIESRKPCVIFHSSRAAAPKAPKILVLVEERLLGGFLAASGGGSTVLQRYLDDLQNEGWESFAYRYDVRSHETGEKGHRHLPSEVLELYKYIREFYFASDGLLNGVVLIGDFPGAGVNIVLDQQTGNNLEQSEMDYFGVDAMLADPFGYWEWLPIAPTLPPGSTRSLRLPFDEERPPNGALYPRTQWSAPGFVVFRHSEFGTRQSEVHHSQRNPNRFGSEPKYWIGRISAAQAAWRSGLQGWEYSADEEIRLLVEYFDRNHSHRSAQRTKRGYCFLDKDFAGGWQNEKIKMASAIPQQNITVHADSSDFPAAQKASVSNYLTSFQQDYLVCQYVMHSDWLNHYFSAESGQDTFPAFFPSSYTSPGSNFSVDLPRGSVQSGHLMAIPEKSPLPRFYLLGGCDVGAILHRPQFMIDGQHISPATSLYRQYGANVLGIAYLMHAFGLAVLAHNVTNPPGDYTVLYQSWQQDKPFGEGVLKLMENENNAKLPHYRNVIFGDPSLRLSY